MPHETSDYPATKVNDASEWHLPTGPRDLCARTPDTHCPADHHRRHHDDHRYASHDGRTNEPDNIATPKLSVTYPTRPGQPDDRIFIASFYQSSEIELFAEHAQPNSADFRISNKHHCVPVTLRRGI